MRNEPKEILLDFNALCARWQNLQNSLTVYCCTVLFIITSLFKERYPSARISVECTYGATIYNDDTKRPKRNKRHRMSIDRAGGKEQPSTKFLTLAISPTRQTFPTFFERHDSDNVSHLPLFYYQPSSCRRVRVHPFWHRSVWHSWFHDVDPSIFHDDRSDTTTLVAFF